MTRHETTTAVLVPVKSFSQAKSRLAATLDRHQRRALARSMASRVVAASGDLPCFVVGGTDEVAQWAIDNEANLIWFPYAGLNQAVTFATQQLATDGFQRVIIAHGDLPRARTFHRLAQGAKDEVIMVTDRHQLGTNVLSIPTGFAFTFHYGPGSAAAHRAEAETVGLSVTIVRDPDLEWDVDDPADLIEL